MKVQKNRLNTLESCYNLKKNVTDAILKNNKNFVTNFEYRIVRFDELVM